MKKKTVVLLVLILAFCLLLGVLGFIFFRFRAAKKQRSEQPPRPVEVINYDEKHKPESRYLYEYDDYGNLTKETCEDEDSTIVTLFEYDGHGNLTKKTVLSGERTDVSVYENEYDLFGRLKRQFTFCQSEQDPQWVEMYYYDFWGNLKRSCKRKPKDTMFLDEYTDIRYRYDLAGNVIWEKHFAHDDYRRYLTTYQYDKNGNVLVETLYGCDGNLILKGENVYDENGLLLKTIHSSLSDKNEVQNSFKTEYIHDDQGRCIQKTVFYSDGDAFGWTEYRYE